MGVKNFSTIIQPPLVYSGEHAKARLFDQAGADNSIRHTTIGDPVRGGLSSLPPADLQRFIESGIEEKKDLRHAPQALRDFFNNFEETAWFDQPSPSARYFDLVAYNTTTT